MGWPLLLLIIALPLAEIAVFIRVAQEIGLLSTVLLAILAGVAGIYVLRLQGFLTLVRAREAMSRGEPPVAEVFDGLCLLVAGLLLLLPGLLSDAVALLLLFPPFRAWVRGTLVGALRPVVMRSQGHPGHPPRPPGDPRVIETEWEVVEDKDRDQPPKA